MLESSLFQFLFIVVLPVVVVAGGLVSLFAVGALFDALDHPGELQRRIETAFRAKVPPLRLAGPKHYYRPYWTR